MRSRSDDELYALQNRWLGPPGRTLFWQARYAAYIVWVGYFLIFLIVRQQLGDLLSGFLGYVIVTLMALLATNLTMRVVTPDRPAGQVLRMFLAELGAPRSRPSVRTVATPDPRWVQVAVARPTPGDSR
ncbi:hypothetical protein Ae168Ps1_2721 [Pseudonocardia sp. Ae168_Ps1]|uniref:hypothetical protein n=1 Tax=unclassified Pseudonocardia TaxID=2619320 RepID=UPI00094AFF6A|nr:MULTISPECIES: hypothetical protein [unclassified Pseudonocardia]OLL74333.1 hypothetical protein Ae150APs1_2711 [Pseudonocardia sp. Ae150A_Ps1]OLL80315.1 hypothetical protein Ae168Ps1_2721 [Pseudonocardia sp. Ae168_Ps1]OLL85559.1 hypothetical protein Ae263Ps1_2614c [Pseudonocardia sp. Ae263_Ps1]OLL94413.1 hypothetical protein Ae356Ps1_4310 [Pseudonocardia sp. Ae356_Ps1]